MSELNKNEILNLLSFMRTQQIDKSVFTQKLVQLKQKLNKSNFDLVLYGDIKKKIGGFEYTLVSGLNIWSIQSQILYEIIVKKNNNYIDLIDILSRTDNLYINNISIYHQHMS